MFLMHMLCNLLIEQWHRYQPDTALEPEFYQNTGGLLYRDYMMTVLHVPIVLLVLNARILQLSIIHVQQGHMLQLYLPVVQIVLQVTNNTL
jgi:hypothetical protein